MNKFRFFLCAAGWILVAVISSPSRVFGQENSYEIYALKFGERTNKVPVTEVAVGSPRTDSVQVCFMYWLLKGNNGRTILVDAGFTDDADINPAAITFTRPDMMLDKLKVRPEDITDIIITHPHWDHIGGMDLYPNATVWMQKEDYDYFVGAAWQKDGNRGGFNKNDVAKIVNRNLEEKLVLVKGDDLEIIPGIRVFIGSKHTYESQFVMVESDDRQAIIASDNAWFYYNLESGLPIPIGMDQKAYAANLKRMNKMVKDVDLIVPGHDPLVFTRFPKVADDVVRIK
jgi:glyoxylase-like metal-dependent hydrolase (beta-lactamase superfamily II)